MLLLWFDFALLQKRVFKVPKKFFSRWQLFTFINTLSSQRHHWINSQHKFFFFDHLTLVSKISISNPTKHASITPNFLTSTSTKFLFCNLYSDNYQHVRPFGLVVWFFLREEEVPGSIPGTAPLFAQIKIFHISLKNLKGKIWLCNLFPSNYQYGRPFGLVVWFFLREEEVPGSIPGTAPLFC